MWVGFFLWRRSCVFILSSCWGWGRLFLSLFWCDCSALFSWGTCGFPLRVMQLAYPSRVPHLADSGWLPYSCGGRLAWGLGCLGTDVLIPHLVFYLVPVQCHALPQGLQLAQPSQLQATLGFFQSLGVCPSASLVAWVGLQPFPSFSGLLLLRLLAGVGGVLHPVSGCSSCGGVCLVCR